MITHTRSSLPLSGLRSVHNARTRIYAAGRDPMFTSPSPRRTIQVAPAFPDDGARDEAAMPLWRRDVIDRLQPAITRHRD